MKGKVKFYDSVKGFGFILGDDGKEYFVHQTALTPGTRITDNDPVTFDVVQGDRGPKAASVTRMTQGAPASDDSGADESDDSAEEESEDSDDDESDDSDDDSDDEDKE